MKILFKIILSFLIVTPLFGQISSLRVNSSDSSTFYVMIQGQQVNEEAAASVKIDSLPSGDIPVDVLLSDSVTHISSKLELKNGKAYVYEISKVGKEYMLLQFSVSEIISTSLESAEAILSVENTTPSADSLLVDSLRLPLYEGPTGCSSPISEEDARAFRVRLEDALFERKRVASIDEYLQVNCVSVDQFASFLETIELEDYRLELIRKHSLDLFDQKNVPELESQLQLKRSKEIFLEGLK